MSIKVLQVMSYDWGGAALAGIRLHKGLPAQEVHSEMLLKRQSRKDIANTSVHKNPPEVYTFKRKLSNKIKQYHNYIIPEKAAPDYLAGAPENYHLFTIPTSKYDILSNPQVQEADIIHLHWVSEFVDYKSFFAHINKPVVWTMHDMNPFTGGCHYAMDCEKYKNSCFACPQLQGTINPNYAAEIQNLKKSGLQGFDKLHIVTPSQWLADCSLQSSILGRFPHHVIHNGFDTAFYKTRNQAFCRELLGLPEDKTVLLFVAGDIKSKPKGYHFLKEALETIKPQADVILCAVGGGSSTENNDNITELGTISDERLMGVVYNAADVFITPSLADNLPNTIAESHLCGIPVIGFPVGGINQMLEDPDMGILCENTNTESLKDAILNFLGKKDTFKKEGIALKARKKYAIDIVANDYKLLYNKILGS